MKRFSIIVLVTIANLFGCNTKKEQHSETTKIDSSAVTTKMFVKIPPSISNLNFENNVTADIATKANLFNYDYFYNGAGVGVEDINNDGLIDIFFCGNQVPNKLYINKGDFTFEDITEKSQINSTKGWSNGVTFVDINNDGWMDIYVSQGGPKERDERKNLLLINQKNETFKESAQEYGLSDQGISTQSAFFDYDKDGDLDCIVMNENELYGVDPINLNKIANSTAENKFYNSSHFYKNEGGTFINQTKEVGLERPIFGLGLSISDINNDGWLDFYIASDYYIPDALFINNKNGGFTDNIKDYTNHISYYAMGVDIADINNDGLQDIFVLDMAANDHIRSKTLMSSMNPKRFKYLIDEADYQHQYMYNALQLNTGLNKFSNISQATQMASTDWSWSVLMTDFDHDQDKDIYITNGYRRYALDNDLQKKVYASKVKYKNNVPLDVKKELYDQMPSEKLPNILFENRGTLDFNENASDWGLNQPSFSNGCAIADFDNDGDLDLVVNNLDESCFLYRNTTMEENRGNFLKVETEGKLSESFAKVKINYSGHQQIIENRRVRGYRSAQQHIAHFGIQKFETIDTVTVIWPSGKSENKYNVLANTTLIFNEANALANNHKTNNSTKALFRENTGTLGINFIHKENPYDDFETEILLPYKQSTQGPFISKGDLNKDGLIDIHVGGASGQAGVIYVQNKQGEFNKKNQPVLAKDQQYEDMESQFFDWDNDGDLDLYVVSGGNEFAQHSSLYEDRLYRNDGKGNLERVKNTILGKLPKSGKTVTAIDFDNDGDQDLIIGNRSVAQKYPSPSSSIIYENVNHEFIDVTTKVAPAFHNFGIVNKVISTDFNDDGWMDFIAVGEWTGIGLFKNTEGVFENITEKNSELNDLKGWWFSVAETDINNDGLPDYLIGNVGANLKFKASKTKPLKIFANDFDQNGTQDIVLSKEYHGEDVPIRGRECSSQQMPFIQQKFKTYNDFANASLSDIYGEELNSGYKAEANEFKSIQLLNLGNGYFEISYLPDEAQFFPIMKCVFIDVNNDGFEDAIVAGNIYETEVETPRLDALSGLVLISNQKDGYTVLPHRESGILLDGNIKDMIILKSKTNINLIATQNNGSILSFSKKK